MKTYSAEVVGLLEELEFLFEKYSEELRATTQPYYLRKITSQVSDYIYHPTDTLVRETLMEHVGSLPMVAIAFYPYIKDSQVDLGRALTMLAIHDIGELITGDEMTFTKKASAKAPEREAAMSLLHNSYHDIYDEMEMQKSRTAEFAKAIDKITPDILDYLTPGAITLERYKHYVGSHPLEIVPLIKAKKRPFMEWNPFMTEFHDALLVRIEAKLKEAAK